MIIRQAKIEDVPLIVEMLANDELGKLREDFQEPLPEKYYSAFENIDNDPNQELVVILNEHDQVIGTLQLSFIQYLTYQGGIRAQIEAVRVHQNHRNKGVGKQLFQWAIKRSKERGAHVVQLTTDKKRPDALKFYKTLGFVDSHEGMKLHII
ncbi:MAG TPA: GNAT family N-acetyltransferase [Muricauda sp.]|uniref:GNAT family N-acetyltransferase n=1 Tax=Flagellimonas aurea TaxID=2915619 RepID=A0ABS3G3Y4_9FLAO|nr:GNAT family N-acetyltransferase [Allomuricauda aurea]MBC73488.1 GNAT family N-acetyltransferase [Allomuricauda sp.]MBO0354123.1 GNAT family N-acetyltransferase [Allomuricauda aurea]UBZ14227.1 GNAT family N-acetyltransferase [Allomuricauda aquimarina]HBU79789.1 GNAT family N-acetyltransferase [Allomuricauda sp.]|tara:strand:- start:3673 stop:4128 length:456 start_codon:yes stop_codon:yes gene_type:complete